MRWHRINRPYARRYRDFQPARVAAGLSPRLTPPIRLIGSRSEPRGPKLRVGWMWIAGILMGASIAQTRAQDAVAEKLMFAAANVLAGTSGISNGRVIVADADHARFRIGLPNQPESGGERVTFRRVQECIYEEKIATGIDADDQFVMVDFGRLTGRWTENGSELDLITKGDAHCFHNPGRTACWPGHVHLAFSNISHQRMVDDATYLIKNGCGMSATGDPY